mgnify:CR=1 FL=1
MLNLLAVQGFGELQDPDGVFRKGQRIRWKRSSAGTGDMQVLSLSAPCGLYWRPLLPSDDAHTRKMAYKYMAGRTHPEVPCEAGDVGAVYHPENLMIEFRYLYNGSVTCGHAIDLAVVSEPVQNQVAGS